MAMIPSLMYFSKVGNIRGIVQRFTSVMFSSESSQIPKYETLGVSIPKPFVYHIELNRPEKLNAMNNTMWLEIGKCFEHLAESSECRAVVLSGTGKLFTAGIDLHGMAELGSELSEHDDVARRCKILRQKIKMYQDSLTALEKCPKPVISAVHSACVGGGVDLICATDIRYCTKDAWFQIKEVDIGMAADVGTLQRLPKVVGNESLVRELAFTARKFSAQEAKEFGMVSKVFDSKESMVAEAVALAAEIATKSPLAVQLTKRSIVFSRDHSVQEGLNHIRDWNMTMLQSEDFLNATMAQATKNPPPTFAKL